MKNKGLAKDARSFFVLENDISKKSAKSIYFAIKHWSKSLKSDIIGRLGQRYKF